MADDRREQVKDILDILDISTASEEDRFYRVAC